MLYARPTLTLGDPSGLRFFAAPLIHNYIADDENPDLKDYRGYVDWVFGIGAQGRAGFLDHAAQGRAQRLWQHRAQCFLSAAKLSGGDLTGWLTLQYFAGYGESLLDYNRKLDSQWRLGIAVAL